MQINFIMDPHFHGKLFESKLKVFNEALQSPADLHVIGGDLLHMARLGDGEVNQFRMVSELNRSFQNASAPVILIEGNHDQFGSRGSALDFFHWPHLTKVANEPVCFRPTHEVELVCIPWIRNRRDWKDVVIDFLNNQGRSAAKHSIIVAHMNVLDSKQNRSGSIRVNPDDHFVFSVEELKNTAFAPTDLICGHLHTRQVFERIRGGYVGAMTQNNFGEEGNPDGYLVWMNGSYRFKEANGPKFHNTTEEEFKERFSEAIAIRDYYKFQAAHPEQYSGFANVVCTSLDKPEIQNTASAYEGHIELSKLIGDYCEASSQIIPEEPFLLEELEKISLSISRSQTGLDEIEWIALQDVGPKKTEIVHRDTYVELEPGLNAITGKNGTGKSLLLESVLAGLYGSYIKRGALKNYCFGKVAFGLKANDEYHTVEHKPNPKGGLVAYFDDVECKLKSALATEVVPRFGDSNVFESVVFMDQDAQTDLVQASEAERLSILSKLLNLDILEDHRKLYAKQHKEEKAKFDRLQVLKEREAEKQEAVHRHGKTLGPLLPPDTTEILRLENILEERQKHNYLYARYESWLEVKQWLEQNPGEAPEVISELRGRVERLHVLDSDITRMKAVLSQKDIGCGPNYLPCSLLRGASSSKLTELLEEQKRLFLLGKEHEILELQAIVERQRAKLQRTHEPEFDHMPERLDSVENTKLQLKALKADRDLYLNARRELDLAQEALRKVQTELRDLEGLETRVEGLAFLERLCSKKGLPLYVISSIVVGLQKQLDEILEMAEIDLRIKISLSKEADAEIADSFHILFSSRGFGFAPAKFASGGQLTMIRVLFKLALMLYLNKYFGNYKVLIMDEPEKGLDVDNLNVLMTLLCKLKDRLNQVIVITHNQQIEAIADNVVRL